MAGYDNNEQILLEDVQLVFKNFRGKGDDMNAEGNRNFCVLLSDEQAVDLKAKGLNVKRMKEREDDTPGELPQAYFNVAMKYRDRYGNPMQPPSVVIITRRGRQAWPEDLVGELDFADIVHVDLLIRTYGWNHLGRSGLKAVVKSLYVTIQEDVLAIKYEEVPEIGASRALTSGGADEYDDIVDAEILQDDTLAIEA